MPEHEEIQNPRDRPLMPRRREYVRLYPFENFLRMPPVPHHVRQDKQHSQEEHRIHGRTRPDIRLGNGRAIRIQNLVHAEEPEQWNVIQHSRMAFEQ